MTDQKTRKRVNHLLHLVDLNAYERLKDELLQWRDQLEPAEEVSPPARAEKEVIEIIRKPKVTYQLELIRCGKKTCKCAKGVLHGPYWYAYYSKRGKAVSKYIGKNLVRDDGQQPSAAERTEIGE